MILLNPQLLVFVGNTRPLFGLDAEAFIAMIPNLINFAGTAGILTLLLYFPVKKMLQARADRVFNDLNDAAAKNNAAQDLKTQYEQKVKDIEMERASILEETRKEANQKRVQILETAKAEAQSEKDRASRDIATEYARAKDSVYQSIVDISTDMAAKLISVTIDKNAHDRLFAEAMAELEASPAFRADSAAV